MPKKKVVEKKPVKKVTKKLEKLQSLTLSAVADKVDEIIEYLK